MKIEIWSDVVCPWCYIGKRRFEQALATFEHRDEVSVEWRSFELDPSRPARVAASLVALLASKYGRTPEQAQEMLDSTTRTAAAEGLDYDFERAVPANTFNAHQVIHLAAAHGRQAAAKERLLAAYFTEGADVDDVETLSELGVEIGLAADDVRTALAAQTYADAVRADEAEATAFGISAVPFFVVDRTYGVSGAQSPDTVLEVLGRAWSDRHPLSVVGGSEDTSCGPEGCAV
ncbi:MAG: DsbA family oxidoreductase [Jatrophihabitantaceae bacterium]